ncbi:unnamed protein product [Cylicocyclus nassatus]|uniref:FACT complex subunit SPT16 middle domain-containing protein n=1 Tax=Cylicocyclus nassatus TaxID=53992 RepID=A0AA36GK75_CYLNA|nr:unnamed protein product [Cylicocyclus nassatus]
MGKNGENYWWLTRRSRNQMFPTKHTTKFPVDTKISKLNIFVDKRHDTIILPIFGVVEPFHISMIKNQVSYWLLTLHQLQHNRYETGSMILHLTLVTMLKIRYFGNLLSLRYSNASDKEAPPEERFHELGDVSCLKGWIVGRAYSTKNEVGEVRVGGRASLFWKEHRCWTIA